MHYNHRLIIATRSTSYDCQVAGHRFCFRLQQM